MTAYAYIQYIEGFEDCNHAYRNFGNKSCFQLGINSNNGGSSLKVNILPQRLYNTKFNLHFNCELRKKYS